MNDRSNNQKSNQTKIAEEALTDKKSLPDPAESRPETQSENEGMISTPNPDQPPSGAFEQEGHRPVLERSRKVR